MKYRGLPQAMAHDVHEGLEGNKGREGLRGIVSYLETFGLEFGHFLFSFLRPLVTIYLT